MKPILIDRQKVGQGHPAYLVAEIGLNHNGNMNLAKKMIESAAKAGATAVKFQNYRTEDFLSDRKLTYRYVSQGKVVRESQFDMFKRCELRPQDLELLKKHADHLRIGFHSTPTSVAGIRDLKRVNVSVLKNGSDFLTHLPMIRAMALSGLPTVLSTGMATRVEIQDAVETFRKAGGRELILLHCVSSYPAALRDVHLRKIQTLRESFDCAVGYSDHTEGTLATIGAVALGACWIEKHFTLNKNLPGPDQRFSADPKEFKELVSGIRDLELALGRPGIGPTAAEKMARRDYRLSCVAARPLPAGHRISENDIAFRRPGSGLPPRMQPQIVGRRLTHSIKDGQLVALGDLA